MWAQKSRRNQSRAKSKQGVRQDGHNKAPRGSVQGVTYGICLTRAGNVTPGSPCPREKVMAASAAPFL